MEIRSAADFVDYLDSIRARTTRVIACIPRDRFEWSPGPGKFSFADLIRHLAATERFMWAENAQGRPSRYPGHSRELADGPDAVLAYLDRCHAESRAIFASLTPEQLRMKVATPGGAAITAWKWLRAMTEHEAHHRGQIYLMLGMLGVKTPPLYGLTSEEVKARSIAH